MANTEKKEIVKPHEVMMTTKPPQPLSVSTCEDASKSYNLWLQQFKLYAIFLDLDNKPAEMQLAVFMTIIGPEILQIFNTFKIEPNTNWKDVCDLFKKHFTPKVNTIE